MAGLDPLWRRVTVLVAVALGLACGPARAQGVLERMWDDLTGRHPHQATNPQPAPPPPLAVPAQAAPAQAAPARATPAQAQPATPPPPAAPAAPPAPPVPVVLPRVQTVADTLEVTGNASSVMKVTLVARVVGYLQDVHFQDGAVVRKGDLLFTIQQDQYRAQLQQAQAQVAVQQAALTHARTEVTRYTGLVRRGAASQVELDNWIYQRAAAEANLSSAQAQVALAQLNLSYTEVRAPFDGQMSRRFIDPGNLVGASGQTTALAEILRLDPIYVEVNISTQQAAQIRANLDQRRLSLAEIQRVPVEAALQGETGFHHRGRLEYVAPAIDAATGTLFIRGVFPNPDQLILPGVFMTMRMPMGRVVQGALLVPDRVLQEDQGGRYLLVVGPNDVVQQRYVQLGQLQGSLRVVTGGLRRDDRVVAGELWRASPGTTIRPQVTTLPE